MLGVTLRAARGLPGALVAATLALSLAACGGGGTPTSPATPAPTAVPGQLWSDVAPLRDAAAASGRMVGAALFSSRLGSDASYTGAAGRHFNYATAEWEMKWDPIQRVQGVYDFSGGDRIVAFAESRGMRVKGHALVWHGATPAWVDALSPPELRIAFEDHIRTVASHYRGHLWAWDVVNEAIDDAQPGLRSTVFFRGLGADYVAEAFRLARQADPEAQLVYNDYGGEGLNRKSNDVYELVRGLRQRGLVDGVGLQMHVSATSLPPIADIAANIRRLAALGLQVNISEMDVRVRDVPGDAAAKLARQRQVYRDVVAACLAEPRCEAVTFWGFTDAHSWIDGFFGPDDPLPFDDQYRAKPAFFGVQDAFLGR
ncbi:MAG TPA: endo-1,4-beta-xylanase [Vicinamibacteria bacterium]